MKKKFKVLIVGLTIQVFFVVFPLPLLLAQGKLPLIKSITSDTLNGKYQQIIFTYDKHDRVNEIIKTQCRIQKSSPNDFFPLVDTAAVQTFSYAGKAQHPISRKTTYFEFDPVDQVAHWTFIQKQAFIYREGKHIQDSITNKENRLHLAEDHVDNDKPFFWKGKIDCSPQSIKYTLYTNYLTRSKYDYEQGETTELLINSQQNITKDAREPFFKSHSSSNPPFYTLTEFDKAINPLRYLNVSKFIPYEKIFLSNETGELGTDEGEESDEYLNWGNTDFNWYFFNENNALKYTITRGETDSPFTDIIQLSYTYNKFNLPIHCSAEIRKEFTKDGTPLSKHQKRFSFRYKQ